MYSTLEKWQATILVLASIAALVTLAIADKGDTVIVGAIGGIPALVLGAGAVAHGVRQGARSQAETDIRADARVERALDRVT